MVHGVTSWSSLAQSSPYTSWAPPVAMLDISNACETELLDIYTEVYVWMNILSWWDCVYIQKRRVKNGAVDIDMGCVVVDRSEGKNVCVFPEDREIFPQLLLL